MPSWINPPFGTALTAHVLAWAVSSFFVFEIVVVADDPNFVALTAICSPVLLSGLTLLCAVRLSYRTMAWLLAWSVMAICIVGLATIGFFMMPVAGLMFWTANEIPDSDW